MATKDAYVFFHELGHAAHKKIDGTLKNGQDPEQEIIAQLTSAVLSKMYSHKMDKFSYEYILGYSNNDPQKALKLIFKVIKKVGEILELARYANVESQKPLVEDELLFITKYPKIAKKLLTLAPLD